MNNTYKTFILVFIFFIGDLYSEKPSHISQEKWEEISQKLLPENHPLISELNQLFAKQDVIHSMQTLKKRGFHIISKGTARNSLVLKHSRIKGFLLKVFADNQPILDEWNLWLKRIQGSELIKEKITREGYQMLFKAPNKWIYLLPHPSNLRISVLVVEDMNLVNAKKNQKYWKNKVNYTTLAAFYDILTDLGLKDSIYIDNSSFSKDGKIAFVDTEHYNLFPIKYSRLLPKLSSVNKMYWSQLIR